MEEKFDKIEKIAKISKLEQSDAVKTALENSDQERVPPSSENFQKLLTETAQQDQGKVSAVAPTELEGSRSIIEQIQTLDQKLGQLRRGKVDNLVAAADDIVDKIKSLKTELVNNSNAQIHGSTRRLLTNRLDHINDNLKVALNKAGVEYVPPSEQTAASTNPINRFLGLMTGAQFQMETLTSQIQKMAPHMEPATMLLLQVKMASVTQEIELFTSMLNKALESVKTIMNVQV